jgi:hypothetical protein
MITCPIGYYLVKNNLERILNNSLPKNQINPKAQWRKPYKTMADFVQNGEIQFFYNFSSVNIE